MHKISTFSTFAVIALLIASHSCLLAQSPNSAGKAPDKIRIGPPEDPKQPRVAALTGTLKLNWDESFKIFTIDIPNDEERPLKVYGVQTTTGLYAADFPSTIPPKGNGTFTLVYAGVAGAGASIDLLRVLTDRAEAVVQINHEREQAVQFDSTTLAWQQDEPAAAKSVVLTVSAGLGVPKQVSVVGLPGSTAALDALGGGRYRLSVTPGSTARPSQFVASIVFDRTLTGVPTLISCSVIAKN